MESKEKDGYNLREYNTNLNYTVINNINEINNIFDNIKYIVEFQLEFSLKFMKKVIKLSNEINIKYD